LNFGHCDLSDIYKRTIRFAAFAHIVGWVKRDTGTIFVGFAYLNVPQQFEIASKLANPTRVLADHRLNPTYDLSFRPTKWIPPICNLKVTRSKPFQPARWPAQQRNMNNEQGMIRGTKA
jgi:hypothetical protein